MDLLDRKVFDPESGEWVNANFQRVAEILHDYDYHLRLLWIPERQRVETDVYPYALAYCDESGNVQYIIMHLTDNEINENLIARIFQMRKDSEDINGYLDAMDAAHRAVELKKQMEKTAESAEFAASLVKTPLHTYHARGKVFNL